MKRRPDPSPVRLQRLADELAEDDVGFVLEGTHRQAVLEELDYVLRPPVHERRVASYGSIVGPTSAPEEWTAETELVAERRPTVDFGDAQIRTFADGISSWAMRNGGGVDELVVFDRSAGSERDLVILAAASGGLVIQRHPNGVIRVVGPFGVVRRDVTGWHHEPPLDGWIDHLPGCREPGGLTTLGRLVDFAVHDLGARGVGATLVLHAAKVEVGGQEHRLPAPPALQIDVPHDLAPLRHALAQTDGATFFDHHGTLRRMGVRLIPSPDAESAVAAIGGTRHTSARRFSYDAPDAVVIVVSEDGPVTVFRGGDLLARSTAD